MEIRLGRSTDKDALVALALENQSELLHGNISVNPERVEQALRNLFDYNPGTHVLFVAETSDGELAGGLLACVSRYYYSEELQAQLIQWYLRKSFRGTSIAPRLVKAFVEWAKARGASEVFMGISSGVDVQLTHRMMRRLGFTHLGGNYAVNLKSQKAS
ncbi:N-acetyltransferase family protein [Limnohabitans sp.]|uniref:GNAT family N-acetyltransferase n=1 Tax=Limnohabitans sp. TaxID=1907725 RepID=UPI0035B3A9BE